MSKKMRGNILLFITAFIWGCAFVAQRTGMEYIGPLTFNGIRSLVGGFTLLIFLLVRNKLQQNDKTNTENGKKPTPPSKKFTFFCGCVC